MRTGAREPRPVWGSRKPGQCPLLYLRLMESWPSPLPLGSWKNPIVQKNYNYYQWVPLLIQVVNFGKKEVIVLGSIYLCEKLSIYFWKHPFCKRISTQRFKFVHFCPKKYQPNFKLQLLSQWASDSVSDCYLNLQSIKILSKPIKPGSISPLEVTVLTVSWKSHHLTTQGPEICNPENWEGIQVWNWFSGLHGIYMAWRLLMVQ